MQTIQSTISEPGVLTLKMNRPKVHNAFDSAMIKELTAALQAADEESAIRLVVISAAGTIFSAGADMN